MRGHKKEGHAMKRTAVILGVAAAIGVFAPAAAGSTGKAERSAVVKPLPVLQTQYNSRSGEIMYRFGNRGLWMS
jgi:hypothetical protein